MKPSISNLFTRPQANAGISIELKTPDGKPSGAHITVLGTDSDQFREARIERSRESANILTLPEKERALAAVKADVKLLASLVVGWDFAEEFTPVNVETLLFEAPNVRDQVDETAGNRALFLRPKS